MPQMIECLYDRFYQKPICRQENQRLNSSLALIKQDFSKWQKKILLRITDDKDLICEIKTQDSFEQGFRLGVKLATEVYNNKGIAP